MKSHSKRILSLVFALLMAFQQVMFAAQTVDLLTPAEQTQTVDLLTGEEENKTVDLLTPAEPSAPIEQPIEQSEPIIEENKETENQTVDLLTPGDDEVVPEEGKKSTTTILIGGEEEEETQDDSWDLTPAEITVPEENHDEEEKKDATFEDEEHHENAGVLPWSTDLVKPWSIYREPKKVYRPGEDLDLTELLVEIKTGRSGSLYNIEDLINDEFTTITRTRKSDGEKVRLDDKIYEDETMTIHMDGCQDLTIDFTVDENLKDEEEALEAFQENLIREEFRDGLDFSLYLIKKGERENPIVAYSLDPHKLTPLGNGVDKKLKDGPLFDLKDINTWDRFDIETIGKVKAILERSAEINNTENVRKKLITQLAIWNVTSNIIPREIDATVSEIEETKTNDFGPELKPVDEEEVPEEKEEGPIEIIDPTTPEEETKSIVKDDEKVEDKKDETVEIKTEEKVEEKTETEENKESEKIEEKTPVESTVHKIVFNTEEIDVPYDEVELSDEEYELYKELTSLEAVELKNEDENLKIYEPVEIEETENQYADLVTIGESDIDSIERVATEVTFDAVEYSFQNLYHALETSSMLGFGQPRDFNVLLKATMKASRKIVKGDKFEVAIISKTLPILNGEEERANDIQIDGKVVATAEYIAEEHKIVYTFVEDLDTDKVEIEQEFKQIKEEKAALLNMLDVSENLVLDAVRGAEGDEDSEENPEELEISPEFEENLIQLKLGNTPVQYNGVSFETKKFRLKTTMTAKAFPIWQIPVDWTFDVNIGQYLKPDPNYPLKKLYDPDNPSVEIAVPTKYNEATHTITYTYVKSISSTKTLDIDQYLAFDIKNIGNKDKIDINISVEPKNNPKQQMPTKTVYRDDLSPVITSAFEVEFDENGEPNLNDGYKFFEYGPSYKVTFNASANPIIENREVKAVEWTVVFDGNGESLNSKKLDLITNFTAVRNSGLEKIQDVTLNGQSVTLTGNSMGDKFLINDSKYFDGHNNSESVYTFKFKTPVDSKQNAYVIDIAAKLRGVNKTGAVRLIMPAYEGGRLEMVSPNDMTHSNRTTISGKFTAEDKAEWIVTEEVSTGDQGALPLIERNISKNQTLDSLNVAYYGLGEDGKMHQISKQSERNNPIKAGNLDGEKTFAPGTIAVYEYKTKLDDSNKPQTYTLSNGAISKYRDVDVNITWSKRVENSKYPEETLILSEKDNEENSSSIKIDKENDPPQTTSVVITKVPNVKIWNIGQNGEPQKIEYKIKQEIPKEGKSEDGKKVKYGEVYKRYEPVTGIYEIQNYIVEDKDSKPANITINKTDEGGNPLSGAKFKLFGIQNTEEQNKSETFTIEGISGQDGLIEFNNIPSGIYTLKEERAPEGYTPLSKNETITVNGDGSVEWTNNIITDASFKTGTATTGWKSNPKYYNGSFAWPGYMNTLNYTEVDKNNNFTSYIMLKPDANTIREGTEYFYTDRSTRVSMFGENLNITDAQIFDVDSNDRDIVKKAMYERNVDKFFLERPNTLHQYTLTNDISNDGNNNGTIVKEANYKDTFLGKNVHTIMIPYKRFGAPNPGWAFLIKVTGKITDEKLNSTFSYRWLTMTEPNENNLKNTVDDTEIGKQTKIESDTLIPVAENRNSALDPIFTIVNEPAKLTKLNIQKQDDKGSKLSGAEFRLYNSDNELINSGVTTSTGKLTFEGLAPGEYILKETKSPEGYHNPELTFKLLVSQDGSILYSATDKEGNTVPEGDCYRVGESSSEGPSVPTGETKITVQKAIMYLDENDHYGKTPGVWEEAAYESYSFEGNFHIENAKAGESWIMDFDDNWNFTQWSGKLPEITSDTGKVIAKGEIDYTNNQIKYTLANGYVDNHKTVDCGIKLNSIRPSKYYVKNNGIYTFRDVINVGANQKVVDTTVNADLFQFYGERGGNQYITQNVDIYKDKNEDRYFMRNIALFNAKGVKNFNGEKIARIYYGSSINNGKEILFGDKQKPTFKPVKVIIYKVEHPNSNNMPLSCGIRPSVEPGYTKIAEYNDFSTEFVQTKGTSPDRVTMNFNPKRVDINDNYRPTIYSNDKVQFLITLPDKINGYVIEQFYQINEGKEELARFENTYTQTFMFHSGGSKTGGWEQIRPTLNSGAGIGGDYIPPKPKNYDLTVFNKKQPGEFIVKKVSEKDSKGNVKELAGAEFTLYDKNGKVVRRNSSNVKGVVEFKGLSEGTYTLKETVPPEGYKATDRTITVKIDKDGKVTFEGLKQDDDIFNILNNSENQTIQVTNKPNKNKVTIVKVDEKVNADGSRKVLPGAIFGLFNEDETPVITKDGKNYEIETDKDGKATFKDLEPGTYIIKEIKAPNGYEKTKKTWKVVVGEANKVQVFERIGKEKKKGLNYSISNSGIESTVNFDNGKPGLAITPYIISKDDGTFTCKLDIESRYNTENLYIGIPLSFELDNKNFKYKYNGNYQESIYWENYPVSYKYGKQTTEFEIIPNDTITAGEYKPISKVIINDRELATGLPTISFANKVDVNPEPNEMKYTIGQAEKQQKMYDYQNNVLATVYSIISKLNTDNSYRLRIIIKPSQRNYSEPEKTLAAFNLRMNLNDFEITTDDDFGYNEISGQVSMQMYMYEREAEEISFTITPRDGKFGHLQPIEFFTIGATKVEEKTDTGQHLAYIEVSNPRPQPPTPGPTELEEKEIEVTPNGNEFSFQVDNKYKGFEVEFKKVDENSTDPAKHKYLEGAEFKIEIKDGDTFRPLKGDEKKLGAKDTCTSDDNGTISFKGLKPGTYRLIETKAPDHYHKINGSAVVFYIRESDGKAFIKEDGRYVVLNAESNKINNIPKGTDSFTVYKQGEANNALEGVEFTLYSFDGKKVQSGKTGSDGKIVFTELEFGTYILKETKTVDGYILDSTPKIINIGKDFEVPTNVQGAHDVSNAFVFDEKNRKELRASEIRSNREAVVYPNSSESIFAELHYKVDPKVEIKPGDTFTMEFSEDVDLDGIDKTPDNEFDIYGPFGKFAEAKVIGEYPNRRQIKYTVTNYVENNTIDSVNMLYPLYVNRFKYKTDGTVTVTAKLGNKTYTDDINVVFSNIFDLENTDKNLMAYMRELHVDTKKFKSVVYVNPKGRPRYNKRIFFSSYQSYKIESVKIYKVTDKTKAMPHSFGIDFGKFSESGLEYYGEVTGNKNDFIIKDTETLTEQDKFRYGSKAMYVLEVDGTVNTENLTDFRLGYNYYEYYQHDDGYENKYFDWSILRNVTEWVPKWKEYYNTSYRETFGQFYYPDSTTEGIRKITLKNHKNKIEYTKVDGTITGTAIDTKPEEKTEDNNKPMSVPRPMFSSDGKALAGVKFQLQKKNSSGEFENYGDPIKSDTNGKFSWEGLPEGEYQVVETEALPGYSKPKNPVSTFKVNAKGEIVNIEDNTTIIKTIIKNYKKPNIEFKKIDGKEKTPLKDAEFTLFKAETKDGSPVINNGNLSFKKFQREVENNGKKTNETYVVKSGEDGKFKFEALEDGIYAVKETKAPKDYAMLLDYALIFKVEGGKIYEVNKAGNYVDKNKKEVTDKTKANLLVDIETGKAEVNPIEIKNYKAEYPATGGVGALPFVFIGMMIMMVGAYMFIRRRDALYE